MMSNISKILAYNNELIKKGKCISGLCDRMPKKKLAILTCMDARLIELLPTALGIKNGDVLMIKTAGARLTGPFDNSVRSLLIGITELGVEEIMVIGHTDCGAAGISANRIITKLLQRGIQKKAIDSCEIEYDKWLSGFNSVESDVAATVKSLCTHPLIPSNLSISGYVIVTI